VRIGFIGCVKSSEAFLNVLVSMASPDVEVVAVVTKKNSSFNADYVDLSQICLDKGIPFHYEVSDDRHKSVQFMSQYKPDVIYCFGWSYLLGEAMLTLAPKGVIGFHPAALPKNRGRHPIIWALVLGLKKTASSFFRIDGRVDAGPILSQKAINISNTDEAESLYEKILDQAKLQVRKFTLELARGEERYELQDENSATYWRKRGRADGIIDWRMHASDIHNLVRGLSHPYPGAEFFRNDKYIKLWKTDLSDVSFGRNLEPGLILNVDQEKVLVKCGGESAIWLLNYEQDQNFVAGDYL